MRTKLLCLWLAAAAACNRSDERAGPSPQDPEPPPPASNRIAVPASVRANLGIAFRTVERRRVAATLRLPGHFELRPQARYEHRPPFAGRVTIRVQQFQTVAPGEVVYSIDAPEWRALQRELGEIETELRVLDARITTMQPLLAALEQHEHSLSEAAIVMEQRLATLEQTRQSVGGQAQAIADAKVQLAQVRAQAAEAAEKHTEHEAGFVELQARERAARERRQLVLASASAIARIEPEWLAALDDKGVPLWRRLGEIEVHATVAGVVDALPAASGSWVEAHELVLTVTDVAAVRFRASALQSDLALLQPGQPATIVPIGPATASPPLRGPLQLGTEGDPLQRRLDLFVVPDGTAPFARPGVAAYLECETAAGGDAELAIPLAAVMQDGLERVFFRRDPRDPDQVIRVVGDLGVDDGRWIEVRSGLVDGDEVVVEGAYELMLASSGTTMRGGHFHADGTWHADDHK